MPPVRRQISPYAHALRQNMTEVETLMWLALRGRRLEGWKFRKQATIGTYVVDFLCFEAGLIVELDGGQHSEEKDAPRTAFLVGQGYRVIRFWNHDVIENIDGVLSSIVTALGEADPHPTLSRKRERAKEERTG